MPMATRQDTRAVVLNLLAAVQANDIAAVAKLYADRVDFRVDWPDRELGGRVPWIHPRRTADDMGRHFESIAANNQPSGEGTSIEAILVDGSDAVVLGTIRNRLVPQGTVYQARFALRLTVEGGRVTRHHVYEDSLSVFRAFEP